MPTTPTAPNTNGGSPQSLPWWQRRDVVVNVVAGAVALLLVVFWWWFLTTPSAAELERRRERIYQHIQDYYDRHVGVGDREGSLRHTRALFKDEPYHELLKHAKETYGYKE